VNTSPVLAWWWCRRGGGPAHLIHHLIFEDVTIATDLALCGATVTGDLRRVSGAPICPVCWGRWLALNRFRLEVSA